MGKIEALQKQIDQIADKVKHLRYMFIALVSGIIGLIFAISQNKIIYNIFIDLLLVFGGVLIFIISIMINKEETKRDDLIKKLEFTKD